MTSRYGKICDSDGKESACSGRDPGSIPGSGRSSGEENGNPLQFSCLENSMNLELSSKSVGSQRVGHDFTTEQQQSPRKTRNVACQLDTVLDPNALSLEEENASI